jgi:hypothetical protein
VIGTNRRTATAGRALALGAAALLVASTALGARVATNRDWVPLQQGNRWSYRVTTERILRLPNGASPVFKVRGNEEDEVARSLGTFAGARNAFEMILRARHVDAATGNEEIRNQSMVVSSNAGRLVMHTGTAAGRPMRILRPVTLLPASPQPGMTWDGGAFSAAGMQFDMQGEVVSFEDVRTPAGEFAGCLKLHLTGQIRGAVDVDGVSVQIEDATADVMEWFAPGVGLVKETSSFHIGMRMPDGTRIESRDDTQRVLDGYQVGSPATAPAARAR